MREGDLSQGLGWCNTLDNTVPLPSDSSGTTVEYFEKLASSDIKVVVSVIECCSPAGNTVCSGRDRLCVVVRRNAHRREVPMGTSDTNVMLVADS